MYLTYTHCSHSVEVNRRNKQFWVVKLRTQDQPQMEENSYCFCDCEKSFVRLWSFGVLLESTNIRWEFQINIQKHFINHENFNIRCQALDLKWIKHRIRWNVCPDFLSKIGPILPSNGQNVCSQFFFLWEVKRYFAVSPTARPYTSELSQALRPSAKDCPGHKSHL